MCMYLCIYVSMYTCVFHIYLCVYISVYMFVCIYCMYICVYLCISMYFYFYVAIRDVKESVNVSRLYFEHIKKIILMSNRKPKSASERNRWVGTRSIWFDKFFTFIFIFLKPISFFSRFTFDNYNYSIIPSWGFCLLVKLITTSLLEDL